MMERRMTDMRVRSAEQVVEVRLRGEMDTLRVLLQAELDAAQREARRLQDQLARSRESVGAFIQRMVGPGSQVEGSIGVDPRMTSERARDYVQRDMDLRDFLFWEGSRCRAESRSRASASAASSARPPRPPLAGSEAAPDAFEASVGPDVAERDEERPR
eukprot:TRINITY_DN6474_c0_g1_i21.p2 TRINITY_DN6474_c0_g1~~TRINITY_DN6474_c0_g1_i21.p2  ORF type:complete len:159 (-),score=18.66 TRINITY_DN6474_c0_g1_i21:383-859(-)